MSVLRLVLFLFLSIFLLEGCRSDNSDYETREIDSELIREEGTDVASLDENNDGTVFQCPMDYQVISDEMETCPVCKMDLEAYTVAEAQQNLDSHYQQH
jgi:hypothetical protein